MNYQLLNYLEKHKIINDRQYGFRHQRYKGDLLSLITVKWNSSIHQFGESKAVALDISKAFDTVRHEALFRKLEAYGVGNSFTSWISNFLTNRSIRVVIDGKKSHENTLGAGCTTGLSYPPHFSYIYK